MAEDQVDKFTFPREPVDDAVDAFMEGTRSLGDSEKHKQAKASAIDFLKSNPKDTTEFCLQVYDKFNGRPNQKEVDTSGIILIAEVLNAAIQEKQ